MFEPNLKCGQDYWAIAVRRPWWLMRRFSSRGLTGLDPALLWPGRYRSEAWVLVGEQTVPIRNSTADGVTGPHASQSDQWMWATSLNL